MLRSLTPVSPQCLSAVKRARRDIPFCSGWSKSKPLLASPMSAYPFLERAAATAAASAGATQSARTASLDASTLTVQATTPGLWPAESTASADAPAESSARMVGGWGQSAATCSAVAPASSRDRQLFLSPI